MKKIRILWITIILMVIFSSICGAVEKEFDVGKKMPQFTLTLLDGGGDVTIPSPGKTSIIMLWSATCSTSMDVMVELNKYYKNNKDKVEVYAVDRADSKGMVKLCDFQNGYSMPILLDIRDTIARQSKIYETPTIFVIDKQGVIQYRYSGWMDKNKLEEVVSKYLNKK